MAWPKDVDTIQKLIEPELDELDKHEESNNFPFGLEYFDDKTAEPSHQKALYKRELLYQYWRCMEKDVGAGNVPRYVLRIKKDSHMLEFVGRKEWVKKREFKVKDNIDVEYA